MTEIVRALVYSVAWADDVDYERSPRVQVKTNDFDLELFGRKEAVRKYRIAKNVLDRLGVYCSEKGSKEEARKAPKTRNRLAFIPLSQEQRKWILAAVKLVIRRAGEVAACPNGTLNEITLQDFPDLKSLP